MCDFCGIELLQFHQTDTIYTCISDAWIYKQSWIKSFEQNETTTNWTNIEDVVDVKDKYH